MPSPCNTLVSDGRESKRPERILLNRELCEELAVLGRSPNVLQESVALQLTVATVATILAHQAGPFGSEGKVDLRWEEFSGFHS